MGTKEIGLFIYIANETRLRLRYLSQIHGLSHISIRGTPKTAYKHNGIFVMIYLRFDWFGYAKSIDYKLSKSG